MKNVFFFRENDHLQQVVPLIHNLDDGLFHRNTECPSCAPSGDNGMNEGLSMQISMHPSCWVPFTLEIGKVRAEYLRCGRCKNRSSHPKIGQFEPLPGTAWRPQKPWHGWAPKQWLSGRPAEVLGSPGGHGVPNVAGFFLASSWSNCGNCGWIFVDSVDSVDHKNAIKCCYISLMSIREIEHSTRI